MEHLTLKAVTTTTDQGLFEAVISTEALDREKDAVSAAGMVAALRKWNRPLPLAWNHNTEARNIFGAIDTQSAKEVGGEVVVAGEIDFDSEVGKEAWRSFKARTIGFSFSYLILQSTKRKGGGRDITELDVFEITATATPMNNATRVISTKSAETVTEESEIEEPQTETPEPVPAEVEPPSAEELRKHTFDLALEMAGGATKAHGGDDAGLAALEEALKDRRVQLALWKALKSIAETGDLPTAEPEPEPVDAETLRKRSFDVALELAKSPNGTKSAPAKVEATTYNTVDSSTRTMVQGLIDGLKEAGVLKSESESTAETPPEGEESETPPEQTGEEPAPETSETSAVEVGDEEPEKAKSTPQDPLRKRTFDLALGISNGGMRVPSHLPEPEPEPEPLNEAELRRRSLQAALAIARGD